MKKHFLIRVSVWVFALLTFLTPVLAQSQTVQQTKWMTEQYPPYNYMGPKGVPVGVTTDILMAMFKKMGVQFDRKSIKLLPWARSYRELQSTPDTALYSTTYTPAREKIFDFVGPAVQSTQALIAKKSRHIKIKTLADMKKYKIGAIRDDVGEQLVVKDGISSSNIQLSANAENMVKKLAAGRVDVIAYNINVAAWQMKKAGIDPRQYETVFVLAKGKVGYAFYKGTDPALLKKLQAALDSLKADGTVQKIKDKYLK